MADFDLGWQMADARHPLSSVDMLSYTVPGAPWIYPPLAGVVFRLLFHLGGYVAISWFCVFALLATLSVVAWRSRPTVLLLLLVAVPALAGQMIPRSGLFTVVIAAIYTRVLLSHFSGKSSRRLWLLPPLMIFWVNLHTGFIAGLGLMAGYIAAEAVDSVRASERQQALDRLKVAAPWLIAGMACTLLNPWGFHIYRAIAAQEHPSKLQSTVIVELNPLYREFSWSRPHLLAPLNAVWWLLALSILAIASLIRWRRIGLALFLALSVCICLLSARTQGVYIPIACLIAGDALSDEAQTLRLSAFAWWPAIRKAGVLAVVVFVVWRCIDVVTDRTAIREGQITLFGAGASWWLPQAAAAFVEQNHLPTELFSTFNLSSYLAWRLGPHYRNFADGRYLPFGDRIISEQLRLTALPLDSIAWRQAADTYHIRTIVFPLSRFYGIESIPLRDDCESHDWVPVYLDPTAIVFVRRDVLSQSGHLMPRVDCQHQQLIRDIDRNASPHRMFRMRQYQMLANAAVIYFVLGRHEDATRTLEEAWKISRDDDSLMVLKGQVQASQGKFDAAEHSFLCALRMHASDAAWYQLGLLYANHRRYAQAIDAFRHALDARPDFEIELSLAKAEVLNGEQNAALQTLGRAVSAITDYGSDGASQRAVVYDLRAVAYSQLSNWPSAVAAEEAAVRETPSATGRWNLLASLYAAAGQQKQALQAKQRAEALALHHP